MSNRFHNKWHRTNHHTYTNPNNPDAGHDPIASSNQPFLGEFILSGALSAVAPLSAYAAHFYSNNTAICSIGGFEGIFVTGTKDAIQAFSDNLSISAYSPKLGLSIASPIRAISANAGFVGIDVYSSNKAISARGLLLGLEVYSNIRSISAFSSNIGLEVCSLNKSISAFGKNLGIEVYSPIRGLSANGAIIGLETYSHNIGVSSFGLNVGLKVESPKIGILSEGSTIGASIRSNNKGISAFGQNIGIESNSLVRGISTNGLIIGLESYSTNIPLSTSYGLNLLHGKVGINTNNPSYELEVNGNSLLNGSLRVTNNVRFDNDVTIYGNLSTLGTISYLDTKVIVTSALEISNIGTGPALKVTQTGEQPIANFIDDNGNSALYVEGTSSKPGWVGIGTINPNTELSVNGSISAKNNIYSNITITKELTSSKIVTNTIDSLEIRNSIFSNNSYITSFVLDSNSNVNFYTNITAKNITLDSITLPVSNNLSNDIVLDFKNNSYIICQIYSTTNLSISSIYPGKTLKVVLSSIVSTPQTINIDPRFIYVGSGRPVTLPAGKVGYLNIESFGTTLSSVIINYFAQN